MPRAQLVAGVLAETICQIWVDDAPRLGTAMFAACEGTVLDDIFLNGPPGSRSNRQITDVPASGAPLLSASTASRNAAPAGQSMPGFSSEAKKPKSFSPTSNQARNAQFGSGSI